MKPLKNETQRPGGATGFQETHETTNAAIVTDAAAERNRFANLAARAAKAGHHLQRLGTGYLISRWGHVRHFVDLDGIEALLRQMGAIK